MMTKHPVNDRQMAPRYQCSRDQSLISSIYRNRSDFIEFQMGDSNRTDNEDLRSADVRRRLLLQTIEEALRIIEPLNMNDDLFEDECMGEGTHTPLQ